MQDNERTAQIEAGRLMAAQEREDTTPVVSRRRTVTPIRPDVQVAATPHVSTTDAPTRDWHRSSERNAKPRSGPPATGHDKMLKAMVAIGGTLRLYLLDGGANTTFVQGVVKHADRFSVTLEMPADAESDGQPYQECFFKHVVASMRSMTPKTEAAND